MENIEFMIEQANEKETYKKQCIAAIMGFVVGDALGVPVEFVSREELKGNPVTGMLGDGTHGQPAGSRSASRDMVR